ncbi:hypothetical protein [Streptomyces flavidovirens]|uniref:hypothetical protein n=1 Tax=Streptomyces flavidovirens TaxID=67298 RepID=UPI000407F303|nr:hypothetical protein [Streptomyces flavidovirens]
METTPLTLLTLALLLERPMSATDLAATAGERAGASPLGAPTPTAAEFAEMTTALRHAHLTCGHPRPESDVHALTERGRVAFARRVAALLATADDEHPAFLTAVGYLGAIDRDSAVSALRVRATRLRERAAHIEAASAGGARIPRLFVIENEYALRMCRAELGWIEETLEDIRTGSLVWPRVEETANGRQWDTEAS